MKQTIARKLARLTTNVVVRSPRAWRLLRGVARRNFDALAPEWDTITAANPAHIAPYEHALDALPALPRRGDQTPIYVPSDRLRRALGERGFTDFADFEAGAGTALLARKRDRS